ncbi:MAG: Ig-like domain-containing protein, partial [bacterium]
MVFHEGDSVSYCIYATDSPQYCPPNNLEFCCTFYVGLQGPVASIVLPQPNTFTACNPQEIVITISDTDGVVPSSILLEVSGRQFTISAPELTYRNDTLRFAPSWLFNNGDTIRVRLIQANDTLGNPLQNPLDFSFFVDLMPPVVLDFSPHEYQVVATPTPTISFVLADSLSGLDTSSFAIIIDNRDTFRVENITWERISSSPSQGRITFETSESGLHWNHNDTATICLIAADNPDYCAPNVMSFCYRFRFDLEGPVSTLINPPMNIISSCVRQGFAVYITDTPIPSEIDTSTIVVAITSRTRNDTLYNTSPYLSWSGDTLIFTPPVDYWVDSETVNVTVVDIRDIYGNRQSSPLSFSFTLDFTPPFVINASPLAWEEVPDRTP